MFAMWVMKVKSYLIAKYWWILTKLIWKMIIIHTYTYTHKKMGQVKNYKKKQSYFFGVIYFVVWSHITLSPSIFNELIWQPGKILLMVVIFNI